MQSSFDSNILVLDDDNLPDVPLGVTVLWRAFPPNGSLEFVSIPELIEDNSDSLKSRLLAWIFDLGETRINEKRLVDHLQIRPNLSAWWMTLIAEKCNFSKSPQINDAIRLLAFVDWSAGRSIDRITLVSSNRALVECFRILCANSGVLFNWRPLSGKPTLLTWSRKAYTALPLPLQALIWLLKHLWERWPLRGVGLQEWLHTEGRITFVSYLFNLRPDAIKNGHYESPYWAHLPDFMQQEGHKTNWVHLYVKDSFVRNAKQAAKAIKSFNKGGRDLQIHTTLDTFLSLRVVFQAIKDWVKLVSLSRVLRGAEVPTVSDTLNLWPLFSNDWQQSMRGSTALASMLNLNLFETAMKSLPKQRVGVYLQENQGWEFGFIHTWGSTGHGRLVGCPHGTVRHWDLRYFNDPRNYMRTVSNYLPLPNYVAVNGKIAAGAYLSGGYPKDELVEVEALRFLHLAEVKTSRTLVTRSTAQPLRVLILGDFLPGNTHLQMRLLMKASLNLPRDIKFIIKPHPNCFVNPADFPSLRLEVKMDSLSSLLRESDVAYASSTTSAAVDAYCAGVPVISVLDPNVLNLSPLRGCEGVMFASTAEELSNELIFISSTLYSATRPKDFFTLDYKLPRWQSLLEIKQH